MDSPRRQEHVPYLPLELRDPEIPPEQLLPAPCSGYGTVYMHKGRDGLTLPHSSGPVEGNINRLKMIKRQMFGSAGLDLLRKRVLLAH
ncbi:hypothetical protein [Micromonospora sediminicola]|uniref:hypothetical protein n=1 Tax=Micromonospora sediminicola TaxID=946078 RepID=UPI0037A60D48